MEQEIVIRRLHPELKRMVKARAAQEGVSLRQWLLEAIDLKMTTPRRTARREIVSEDVFGRDD